MQLIQYSRLRARFPSGTQIAGIAVGGLDQEQAADRSGRPTIPPSSWYTKDQSFQVKPSQIGFELDVESMIARPDQQRVEFPFWSGFGIIFGIETPRLMNTPLVANIDENRLRLYLMDEVASRYDQMPESSIPLAGTTNFQYGQTRLCAGR